MAIDPQRRLHAAAFLGSFDRFTIPPLLVAIHRDLDVSLGAAAVVASAYFVAYGLSQPLWGALSDRVGRVAVLRGTVAAGGAVCVVAALAPTFGLLLAARTLAGFFFAAVMPTAMTYTGDTVGLDRRQHALAVLMAAATTGVASGTAVSGVAASVLDWRAAFLVSAALAAAVSLLLRGLPESLHPDAGGSFRERVRGLRRDRWVAVVVGIAFLEGAVIFGALTFVAAALEQSGVGVALAGSAAAGFGLANAVCTPLITRAIPIVSSPVLMAGGAAFAGAGLLVAAIDTTVVTAVLATSALGAGFGFLHSTMQLWATQVHPQARALTVSLFAGAVFTGGAVASAAAAPLADAGRFSLVFLLGAAGAGVLALGGPPLRARYLAERHPPAPADAQPVAL
ncbi:MAG TPA: MFS transporter [Baekduia sp.]|nr:MFS transporter [Baekduia sp.]